MKDLVIVLLTAAWVWCLLSWASGGAVLMEERSRRMEAEQTVDAQATRIALLLPPAPSPPVYCGRVC